MKQIILCAAIVIASVCVADSQTLPAKITEYLNANHRGWKKAPGFCEGKKWFLTGDFDGNKRIDYVVRFKIGKTAKTTRMRLYAFLKNEKGFYTSRQITENSDDADSRRSGFAIVKKGTMVNSGKGEEGEAPTIKLKNDAVSQYICETDAATTYIFKNQKFQTLADQK